MKIPTPFSRPSAASGIGLTDRYRHNPYVRSTVNIILLQLVLAVLLVVAFGYALSYQQEQTIAEISRTIQESVVTAQLGSEAPPDREPDLDTALTDVHDETLTYLFLIVILLAASFAYFAARYALRPTRNSLQFQKQFIGNLAHEVRTPLSIIKTNTEVALMDPALGRDMRTLLTTTLEELDRISGTINNLLSFDALVRPNRNLFSSLDITDIAAAVVVRHQELAQSRGVELSFSADEPYTISGNQTGIDQVLTNLVKNAINYTPQHEGGSVSVTVRGDLRTVTIAVADTGVGIARKDLYHIFEPYYRADTSRVRGISGGTSGLGLAIVNEIVRQHGGKIFVRSALNRGTTIEVTFLRLGEDVPEQADEDDVEEVDLVLS